MRILKRFGIVAALTMAVALAALSASASATVLCSTQATTCPKASILPAESYVSAGLNAETLPTSFTITTSNNVKVGCEYGAVGSKTSAEVGNPLPGQGEGMLWGCSMQSLQSSCQNISVAAPASIEASENGNGTLTVGSSSSRLSLDLNCTVQGEPLTCEYSSGGVSFSYAEGELKTEGSPLRKDGSSGIDAALCGESAVLTANMVVFGFSGGFSRGGTVLCSAEAATVCPNGSFRPKGSLFVGGINSETIPSTNFSLTIGAGVRIACNYGGVSAKTTAAVGSPLEAEGQAEFWGCSSVNFKSSSCQSLAGAAPAGLVAGKSGSGSLTLGNSTSRFHLTLSCTIQGSPFTCKYSAPSVSLAYSVSEGLLSAREDAFSLDGREGKYSELYCGTGAKLSLNANVSEIVSLSAA